MTVRWQAKLTNRPSRSPVGERAAMHADIGIDRTGRLDDIRVPFAWVGDLPAVAHQEPAIEADARLVPDPVAQFRGVQRPIGRADSLGNLGRDELEIRGVGLALEAARDRTAAVRMAGSDQHVRAGNLCVALHDLSRPGRRFRGNEERVDSDQSNGGSLSL